MLFLERGRYWLLWVGRIMSKTKATQGFCKWCHHGTLLLAKHGGLCLPCTVVTPKSPPPDGDYFEKIKRLPLDNKLRKIRSLGKTSQRMYARCTRPFALLDRDVTCEWASTYAVNPPCGDYFEKIIGFILRKILDWGWQKRRYYIQWETVKEEITTTVKKIKKIT